MLLTGHKNNKIIILARSKITYKIYESRLLELSKINKSFGHVKPIKIFLKIKKEQFMALLGENGAGKSTLMSIVMV